jgi:MFS family permease
MTRARKALLLGSLYAAQGLPYGFFTQALPVLLRELGTSLATIGDAALLGLPWALKALWAPLVERWGTPRRWLLGLQAAGVLAMAATSLVDPSHGVRALMIAVLLTNLVAATQDVATDGLAVATLQADERGWGNGLQVAGYRVGMVVGGGFLLVVFGTLGWTATLLALAAGLALCTLPLLADPSVGVARPAPEDGGVGWDWLRRPGAWPWVAVLVAAKVGDYVVQGMLRPWLSDGGVSPEEIGTFVGVLAFGAGLVGAMAGGLATGRLGRVRALVVFGLLQSAVLLGYAGLAAVAARGAVVWAAVAVEHLVGGLFTAALFTAMMDACRAERGATDYTLQASVVVLASMVGATVSGHLATALGYPGVFAIGAALSLLAPALAGVPACTAIVRGGERPTGDAPERAAQG